MQYAFRGHMVVLCDQNTASDGEAFAEGFKRLGLGEVIGTRTWGGEIWLSYNNLLTDQGIASVPQSGSIPWLCILVYIQTLPQKVIPHPLPTECSPTTKWATDQNQKSAEPMVTSYARAAQSRARAK